MLKNTFTILLVLALVPILVLGQNKSLSKDKKVIPLINNNSGIYTKHTPNVIPNAPQDPGELFITTDYDYAGNNTIPRMVALAGDLDADGTPDPIFTAMQRFDAITTVRKAMFGYKAFDLIDAFSAFDETAGTSGTTSYGWGNLEYSTEGWLAGNALIFAHSNTRAYHSVIDLVNLTPILPFPTTYWPGNFPGYVYLADGTILGIAPLPSNVMYASVDEGVTFDSVTYVGANDPQVSTLSASANTPSEVPFYRSPNGQYLAAMGTWDGVQTDTSLNPDVVYLYYSTDGGASWSGKVAGVGSGTNPEYGQVVNRNYAPYFSNFGQLRGNISNDGVMHVVINGYGEGVLEGEVDTTNVFPILYWNSRDDEWISLSIPGTDAPDDGVNSITGGTPARIYPGNGIGQAYPGVSLSPDGHVVFVYWQCMEYTGEIGNSLYNIYPGDGGANTGPIYYTDLHYTYSEDGGKTWSPVTILKGDASVMEQFPAGAQELYINAATDTATFHYVYQEDVIPGAAIFTGQVAGQNSFSNDVAWRYDKLSFPITPAGAVGDPSLVSSFELSQNYPNPFNPNTQIKYSIAERSNVTLKVYDVLGKEVATLVNTTREAGSYDVNFDASSLSSGLYIYTIQAGSFSESKKMMLLK